MRRVMVYLAGLLILAFGVVLNTKTNLGVSAIISVPFGFASIWNLNLGNTIFVFYIFCVFMQFVLLGKSFTWIDLLQLPMSLVSSQFINLFDWLIQVDTGSLALRILMLAVAVTATGVGSALIVMMELIPNPADALAQVTGEKLHRNFGFGKNVLDGICLLFSVALGLTVRGTVFGIGVGTVCAAIFTGRVIAATNYFFKRKIQEAVRLRQQ